MQERTRFGDPLTSARPDSPSAGAGPAGGPAQGTGQGTGRDAYGATGRPDTGGGTPRRDPSVGGGERSGGGGGALAKEGRHAATEARGTASDIGQEVRQHASAAADQVKQNIGSIARQGKERAAEQLGALARAMHAASDELRNDQHEDVSRYADMAAARLEDACDYIRDSDPSRLMSDLDRLARRRPELFLGGAVVAGLLVARFLKSSSSHRHDDDERPDRADRHESAFGRESPGQTAMGPAHVPPPIPASARPTGIGAAATSPVTNPGPGAGPGTTPYQSGGNI